ncbi:hypothetical protein F4811DRAFT_549118 [Daldinia bambusicola]|nr:hypothetical protein F4811DRAFT_549118 [Daldinia bambusicola]
MSPSTRNPRLLANCPAQGTPIRGCAIPFDELPDTSELKLELNKAATFDWSYPKALPQGPVILNIYMRNLDEFISSFQSSREKDDLEQFKETRLRPEFASLPDEEILDRMGRFAQDRALMINYLLGSRVSPVYHQEYVDERGLPDSEYEQNELKRDRPRMARKMVETFWGFAHSGDPLPSHEHKQLGISAYDGWAERIDDKLTTMAERLLKEPKKLRDLYSNPIVIESDDSSEEVKSKPKSALKNVTITRGNTKFTKEVSGEQHTTKKRAVLPNKSNLSSVQTLKDAGQLVSPKFGQSPCRSPKRKDRKKKNNKEK